MAVCCDTSFLFSLYGDDSHTDEAVEITGRLNEQIVVTALTEFELENSLRFAEGKGWLARGKAGFCLAEFASDVAGGRVISAAVDLSRVIIEAKRLSAKHTMSGGHRGFDILHVAAANCLKVGHFLTFDINQRQLAEAEGLDTTMWSTSRFRP
jgi:predicted nucleic acid-binding protein